jgi:hypothetical protein
MVDNDSMRPLPSCSLPVSCPVCKNMGVDMAGADYDR